MATKRKPGRPRQATTKQPRRTPLKIDLAAIAHKNTFSKDEFCARNSICRATFDNWVRGGLAPAVVRIGSRVFVTAEAEKEWVARFISPPIGRPRKDAAGVAPGEEAGAAP
jgi:hypothetical protein